MSEIKIVRLGSTSETCAALSEILIEVVVNGGSVHFMHPLAVDDAMAFWKESLEAADRGERIILGAFDDRKLVSTVTLQLKGPPNQPHRGEIAKMMTRISHRGRGIASVLLAEAERIAVERGRTLLVLDTAIDGGASALYERHGYIAAGEIPDYAFKPHGGLTGTRIFWKRLGAGPSN